MKGFYKGTDGHWWRKVTGTYWDMVKRGEVPPPDKGNRGAFTALLNQRVKI